MSAVQSREKNTERERGVKSYTVKRVKDFLTTPLFTRETAISGERFLLSYIVASFTSSVSFSLSAGLASSSNAK